MNPPPHQISIVVDGTNVTGEITHHDNRCVAVRLIEPFGRLSESVTIPLFATRYTSFEGEAGLALARHLLADAYRRAVLFDRFATELRRLWRFTQGLLLRIDAEHPDAPARIAEERREIRARLRAGEISAREHQRLLHPLNRRAREFDRQRYRILRQFEDARPWREEEVGLQQVLYFLGEDEAGLRPDETGFGRED